MVHPNHRKETLVLTMGGTQTFGGTPRFTPPEITAAINEGLNTTYGKEVDSWTAGCALGEMYVAELWLDKS